MVDLCSKRITLDPWHDKPCGRPVVEDGLCKLHLGVRNRRKEKDSKWAQGYKRGEELRAEAERLSDVLEIPVRAEYSTLIKPTGYTGNFVVPGDWLRNHVTTPPPD